MPKQLNVHDARSLLERNQFELQRSRNHLIYRKGSLMLTLPTTGNLNPHLTQRVIKAVKDIQRSVAKGISFPPAQRDYPATVIYAGEGWAIYSATDTHYTLQSLHDGHRISVAKDLCHVYNDEGPVNSPLQAQEQAQEKGEDEPMTSAPTKTATPPIITGYIDVLTGWRETTQKVIESLRVRIEVAEASIRPMKEQLSTLEAALNSSLNPVSASPSTAAATPRKVGTKAGHRSHGGLDDATFTRLISDIKGHNYSTIRELKLRYGNMATGTLYRYINGVKEGKF